VVTPVPLPCGEWPSPLTPELAAAGAVSLSYAGTAGGRLVWVEGRPAERGRSVLMAWAPGDAAPREIGPPEANVRSRVHEYGGTPWAAVGSRIAFTTFADQALHVVDPATGATRRLATPAGTRHADGIGHPDGRTLITVREDHRPEATGGGEAKNGIVAIDLDDPADEGTVLYAGSDFVAAPAVSACGTRLAFIAWDHPSMPWDETRLVLADLVHAEGGRFSLANQRIVAGGTGAGESVLEPAFAPDGTLCFCSDRDGGFWNPWRLVPGAAAPERVMALEA
jgi:dipeptidyl aminopeptidase/acylaminoacyl peptidase